MTAKFRSIRIAACVLATLITAPALAGSAAESVSANEPFVRMVPPGMTITGAFMVLKNADSKDHRVVKTESQAARAAEMHAHTQENGMMKMRPIREIEIKAGGETALKPGGLHLMLIDLKQGLKEGDKVQITLTFEDGSSRKVEAPVRNIQAEMEMKHDHMHMH